MAADSYYDDIPELVQGRLAPARAAEILRAAQTDEALRRTIDAERALESVLEMYESPQPSAALQGSFWRRFHEGRAEGGRRAAWALKLVGPLAAGVLILIGVVAFFRDSTDPVPPPVDSAQNSNPGDAADADLDELAYLGDVEPRQEIPALPKGPDLDALETMQKLNSEAFLPLDGIGTPENVPLVDNLELLKALDRAEGR